MFPVYLNQLIITLHDSKEFLRGIYRIIFRYLTILFANAVLTYMLRYIPLGAVVDISRVKYDADVHAAISIIRIRLGRRRIAYYVVSLGAVWNGKAISAVMLDSDVTQDGIANVVWTSFWTPP